MIKRAMSDAQANSFSAQDGYLWCFVAQPSLFDWMFTTLYHPPLHSEDAIRAWAADQNTINIIPYASFAKGDKHFGSNVITDTENYQVSRIIWKWPEPAGGNSP